MKNKPDSIVNHELKFNSRPRRNTFLNLNFKEIVHPLPEVLFITSFPPRECGIATYTQDLMMALRSKFKRSFNLTVAALDLSSAKHHYSGTVDYILETDNSISYPKLADAINENSAIELVVIEHEFGLFSTHQ